MGNNVYNSLRRNFLNGNSYLAMMAWYSRNSPRGRFHNETIAQPLAVISIYVRKNDIQKVIAVSFTNRYYLSVMINYASSFT